MQVPTRPGTLSGTSLVGSETSTRSYGMPSVSATICACMVRRLTNLLAGPNLRPRSGIQDSFEPASLPPPCSRSRGRSDSRSAIYPCGPSPFRELVRSPPAQHLRALPSCPPSGRSRSCRRPGAFRSRSRKGRTRRSRDAMCARRRLRLRAPNRGTRRSAACCHRQRPLGANVIARYGRRRDHPSRQHTRSGGGSPPSEHDVDVWREPAILLTPVAWRRWRAGDSWSQHVLDAVVPSLADGD